MFKRALQYRQRSIKQKNKVKCTVLLIDGDRDKRKDGGWTLTQLKQETESSRLIISTWCIGKNS
ncbi:MAG: hypothetical protein A3E87_01295 [Gammaproteobacteria bacterium RIFCSPHIGHO2_12_FULL_35_23]|nr:MAG: hypothetical protein A3E87_01295 [Gammaproteobacteria bacterium RIFCSPHIGHO2_12_FULL_35_23]